MYLTDLNFREFYPQNNVNFKFTIYDYDSQDFQVGLSGNYSVYFTFKTGLIRDSANNLVGVFNGGPVSIDGYLNTGSYTYYINDKPVARDLVASAPLVDSYFNSICVKVNDGNGINLNSFLYGTTFPTFSFNNFYSTNGLSGKISHNGSFPVKIFSASSPTVTGDWLFPTVISPGETLDFFNYGNSGLSEGSNVSINLETSFGKRSYSLKVRSNGDTGNAEEDPDTEIPEVSNGFVEFWKISGEPFQPVQADYLYELDYSSGPDCFLGLQFDYIEGKTGDLFITQNFPNVIRYTGELPVLNGTCSGYLFNNKPFVPENWIELDEVNAGYVLMYPNFSSRYFEGLVPTGTVRASISLENSLYNLNDTSIVQPNFFVDLGGYTGTFTSPVSNSLTYNTIFEYKNSQFYNGESEIDVYGDVGPEDNGILTLGDLNFELTGVILQNNSFLISDPLVTSNASLEIYPYRGVGFASNTVEDTFLVSGDKNGSFTPFMLITNSQPTIFFKNIPNITYNGEYEIEADSMVSGIVLLKNKEYRKEGGSFSLSTSTMNRDAFVQSYIEDSMSHYKTLNPMSGISGAFSDVYIVDKNQTRIPKQTNWNSNNFITYLELTNSNNPDYLKNISPFKYDKIPRNTFLFNEPEFLYNYSKNFIHLRDYEQEPYSTKLPFNIALTLDQSYFTKVGFTTTPATAIGGSFTLKCDTLAGSQNYLKIPFIPKSQYQNGKQESWYNNIMIKVHKDNTGYIQFYCPQASSSSRYVNIDLSAETVESTDPNFKNIHHGFVFYDQPEIAVVYISIVNSAASAPLSTYSSSSTYYFKEMYLSYDTSSSETKHQRNILGAFIKDTAPLTKWSCFDYFMYRIHNQAGSFDFYQSAGGDEYSVFLGDIPKYGSSPAFGRYVVRDTDRQINSYITSSTDYSLKIIDESDYTANLGSRLWDFFIEKIWGVDGSNLFVQERNDKDTFFGMSFDETSLYVYKKDKSVEQITSSDSRFGQSVAEILRVIKYWGVQPSTKIISYLDDVNNSYLARVPIQLDGTVTPLKDSEIASTMFSGKITKDKTLYIPAGYARYYPDNATSRSFGYFFETNDFYTCKNNAVSDSNRVSIFPGQKELLNSKAKYLLNLPEMKAQEISLTRLVGVRNPVTAYKNDSTQIPLTTAYFDFTYESYVEHTGLFRNFTQLTKNVWEVKIADDQEMSENVFTLNFDEDSNSYGHFNFGINDNELRTKYIKVRQFEPYFKFSGVRDLAKITVSVTNSSEELHAVEKFVP